MLASGRVAISRYSDEFKDVFVMSPVNDEQKIIQDHFLINQLMTEKGVTTRWNVQHQPLV